jgi:uncharacterized protein YyaL (SSP411 family)
MSTSAANSAGRATDAYNAMQTAFYQPRKKLYREMAPYEPLLDQPNSFLWPFEEAAKATLLMYGMPGAAHTYAAAVEDRLTGREVYWDGGSNSRGYRSYPKNGDRYYDDNCWVGSDLLQHHLLTSTGETTSTALDRARGVFAYIQTGWTTNLPKTGGVRWVDAAFNGDRAADSTGGWAKLAAHLYDVTGRTRSSYLETAIAAYDWTRLHLLASNGLYANSVRADGTLDPTQWIYNQGILIGAGVLLHRVTGTPRYLTQATQLADASLAVFGTDPYYSGTMGAYAGRGIFNAIFFRNLLMLYAVNTNPAYLQRMQAYADAVWTNVRDRSNLFRLHDDKRVSLLDQASMVQVFALLSWDLGTYSALA